MEIWKDIEGYEGIYQISSFGRIKCLSRKRKYRNYEKTIDEYIRNPEIHTKGYLRITLSLLGETKRFFVHRLVAIAFIDNYENKPYINHKNGIKSDNNISNLEWVTHSENIKHSYDVLGKKIIYSEERRKNISESNKNRKGLKYNKLKNLKAL
jgi:hypothetical protein